MADFAALTGFNYIEVCKLITTLVFIPRALMKRPRATAEKEKR